MSETVNRMITLLAKHLQEEGLEASEKAELEQWLSKSERNMQIFEKIENKHLLVSELANYGGFESGKKNALLRVFEEPKEKVVVRIFPWRKYAAAAAILLFIAGAYFWSQSNKSDVAVTKTTPPSKPDLAPGLDGAILKLAGGQTIVLDSAANGTLATQGGTQVVKQSNGQLVYNIQTGEAQNETIYNELSTPRGRKYQVMLPDGSNVWLNAASSIRYPTQFAGKERRVEITGEAYFEVAHNAQKPFIVHVAIPGAAGQREADIQVLGTHFNVMAYGDEEAINTTLLQGAVKIISNKGTTLLAPGQQAQLTQNNEITLLKDADVDKAVAWKDGYFIFKKESIEAIMRQVARWYNVEIEYKGEPTDKRFYSKIPRTANVSTVFESLEATGSIHFKIDGKKIIVTR